MINDKISITCWTGVDRADGGAGDDDCGIIGGAGSIRDGIGGIDFGGGRGDSCHNSRGVSLSKC